MYSTYEDIFFTSTYTEDTALVLQDEQYTLDVSSVSLLTAYFRFFYCSYN